MHQCEYPDSEKYTERRILDNEIVNNPRTKIISTNDAPSHLQLNWDNVVLWRMLLHYPVVCFGGDDGA